MGRVARTKSRSVVQERRKRAKKSALELHLPQADTLIRNLTRRSAANQRVASNYYQTSYRRAADEQKAGQTIESESAWLGYPIECAKINFPMPNFPFFSCRRQHPLGPRQSCSIVRPVVSLDLAKRAGPLFRPSRRVAGSFYFISTFQEANKALDATAPELLLISNPGARLVHPVLSSRDESLKDTLRSNMQGRTELITHLGRRSILRLMDRGFPPGPICFSGFGMRDFGEFAEIPGTFEPTNLPLEPSNQPTLDHFLPLPFPRTFETPRNQLPNPCGMPDRPMPSSALPEIASPLKPSFRKPHIFSLTLS